MRKLRTRYCPGARLFDWGDIELAYMHLYEGRHAAARRVLRAAPRRGCTPQQLSRIHQGLAELETAVGNAAAARRHIRVARRALQRRPSKLQSAFVDTAMANIEIVCGTPRAAGAVLRTLQRAERVLRSLGLLGLHGLAKTLAIRGQFHLRRGETAAALQCCLESLDLARRHRFFPIRVRSLLLMSYLLVEGDIESADRHYEAVLRDLGLVHDPVLLFRVIANLYHFTWKLDSELELTVHHYEQLQRLKERIAPGTYRRLFAECVTSRVMQRYSAASTGALAALGRGRPR